MAFASTKLPKGYRFEPSDEILVQFLYDKVQYGYVHYGVTEHDIYGLEEPWDIWDTFGGNRFRKGTYEDLYFFTKLKKVSINGFPINRRVGSSGTWFAAFSQALCTRNTISHGDPVILAKKTYLRYENEGSPNHGAWNMNVFYLDNIDESGQFHHHEDQYVLCRLRQKIIKGRKKKDLASILVQDHDIQPNMIGKKPILLELGCEKGVDSCMGSTSTVLPPIDQVQDARNLSNSSKFTSMHGINVGSRSFTEDVGINTQNHVVEEHSNCTETPLMSLDDVFEYDNLCAWFDQVLLKEAQNLEEGVSTGDAAKYFEQDLTEYQLKESLHHAAVPETNNVQQSSNGAFHGF